jgi:hypothetical protein
VLCWSFWPKSRRDELTSDARRSAADRGQRGKAAGAVAQAVIRSVELLIVSGQRFTSSHRFLCKPLGSEQFVCFCSRPFRLGFR